MKILAIDFGDKRIGLALSDPLGFTAQGLETLPNQGPTQVLDALSRLCKNHEVGEVVIGLPINMNGSVGERAKNILELIPKLERSLGIPVKTWDERLTSREVGRLMIEEGLSRKKQKEKSDLLSATIILQSYLEKKRLEKR